MRPQIRRAAYFLAAPMVCLIVFWRVPYIWFVNDDFAWLSLPSQVHGVRDLVDALFSPRAQGTIRFLSERLFFLVIGGLFGLHALPFRLWTLATWFADLTLASLVGARLTGSRAAGLIAAVLWTTSACIATPLSWASAYNEVLCAFFILGAFYSRLRWLELDAPGFQSPESGRRAWRIAEWVFYLAGFGALEVIVVYPALIALHALCVDRKRIGNTLPFFVPAIAFTVLHFLLIPQNPGAYYNLVIDQRLPKTFLRYLAAALGPGQFDDLLTGPWTSRGIRATAAIGLALGAFATWQLRQKKFVALFCCGWFLLLLAPVLPLPNHLEPYYATMPVLGLAWLSGWAIAAAWRAGWVTAAIAVALAALFLTASIREINLMTLFAFKRTDRFRVFIRGLEDVERLHPGAAILLQGVDNNLFQAGFQDGAFRLFGLDRVYLIGSTEQLHARADLGGLTPFRTSPSESLELLERGQARAIDVSGPVMRDVTDQYEAVLRADPAASRHEFVDVGDPFSARLLGPTWFNIERGFRWMPKKATVTLSGPASPSARLYVTGYAPAGVFASGPVTLSFRAAGVDIGSAALQAKDERFSLEFPMPPALVGQSMIEITIEVSKVFRIAGDQRDLGVIFGTFGIR
jgi:hypothetical protein